MSTTKKYVEVNCQVYKQNPNHSLGFSLAKSRDGNMMVARIHKGGYIDQQTQLAVGDVILAINNVGCTSFTANDIYYKGLSASEAGNLLKMSKDKVSIRAMKPDTTMERTVLVATDVKIVEATITKKNDTDSLGFTIGTSQEGRLIIKKTHRGGLVTQQGSALRPGYYILSINGEDATDMTPSEAVQHCKSSRTVTIRAQKPALAKNKVCRTTVFRTSTDSLGMTLAPAREGGIRIKAIQHDSLVYHTGFQAGWTLLSINELECANKTVKDVHQFLSKLPAGNVILRARVV